MVKTLVCRRCGEGVPARSFRMVTACPHCGYALKGEIALEGRSAALAVAWALHWLRLVAGVLVAAGGAWLFCALLRDRTGPMYFPCRTHPGASMVFGAALTLGGALAAAREAIRLRRLRRLVGGGTGDGPGGR